MSRRTHTKDDPAFEINLTKAKWEPKTIEEIPKVVSRSFERELTLRDIKPLCATDHVKTWPLHEDSDIPVFIKEKSMLNEAFAEKVIRFKLPKDVMPPKWEPKKVKILAKGDRVAKYFGEDKVGERNVEVSLKMFDCGHFYMKQTLPGSGISPHWTIFEGAWEHTDRGVKLDYLIRYSWQASQKPKFDLSIEAVPWGWSSTLAWSGEAESQLNGNIPAVVGTDKWCWVEIYRDADKVEKVGARFNEDFDTAPSMRDGTWKEEAKPIKPPKEFNAHVSSEEKTENVSEFRRPKDEVRRPPPAPAPAPMERERTTANAASYPTTGTATSNPLPAPKTAAADVASVHGGEESAWPLYIGLAIFLLILAYFARQQMQEKMAQWQSAFSSVGEL